MRGVWMRRGVAFAAIAVIVCASASTGNAQIIYEPVQYQYGGQNAYYYGGCDPRVHESAAWPSAPGTGWGRGDGWAFRSAGIHTHRAVATERPRTFTDALPYRNAFVHGFTDNDARNEAYARQPHYFRKSDLLLASRPDAAGRGRIVPACWADAAPASGGLPRGAIVIIPSRNVSDVSRGPRPVLVIPKDLLERELPPAPAKSDEALITRAD